MQGFVQGADRQQTMLFPECLDDWVDESNSIRAVDVFVDALELGDLGFDGVTPAATGRPAYHPSPMLKLYIYGYLNRVQSSRRLEREAGRNLEVMWLTGRLAPDHKTIADFRKDNGPAIKKVCAQFVELCRKMSLLTKASVAIDGSKFKAVNSRDNNFTQGKIQRRQKQIEESVARYMSQLETADRQTAAGEEPSETVLLSKTRLKEKLAKLEEEVKRLAAISHRAVYLHEVCTALNVSAQTLRRCCEEHLGMSPIYYLWLHRMNLARQDLQQRHPQATVTAVAMNFGFWHLGRFAGEYRSLFGESPSETLRR